MALGHSSTDNTVELAKNLIRLGDPDQVAEQLTASLLAGAFLLGVTPRDVSETLFMGAPDDDTWRDEIHPQLEEETSS
jgi:alkanesulfonate monooxygenase SsuD/methylene tetrahydromethanopterin reductase-like flavin-dependent oxidoreductase (luciferase family)